MTFVAKHLGPDIKHTPDLNGYNIEYIRGLQEKYNEEYTMNAIINQKIVIKILRFFWIFTINMFFEEVGIHFGT